MKHLNSSAQSSGLLCFLLITVLSFSGIAQVQEAWVGRYNNGITNGTSQAVKMALDSNGDIYVTGFSQNTNNQLGYVTIKYAPNGNQLWAARYDSTNYPHTTPAAITLDNSNNVFITGTALTIKYDTNGNQLWTAPYAGTALATDKSNNVYVAGFSQDFGTVKLSPQGSNIWLQTYVEQYGPTISESVLLDSLGNVYVSGSDSYFAFYNNGIFYGPYAQLTIIKYDVNGIQVWIASQYPDPSLGHVQIVGAAFDSSNDLYLSTDWEGGFAFQTYKYGSSGDLIWTTNPDNASGPANGFALDNNTNVLLTGQNAYSFNAQSAYNYYTTTFKLNSSGAAIWTNTYPKPFIGSAAATSVATDSANNVYITGYAPAANGTNEIATIKYTPNGSQAWVQSYASLGNGTALGQAIAVDKNFNVYVTGYETLPGGGTGIVTIKYIPVSIQPQTNGTMLIEAQGSPGESFDIEASSDLMNWLDLGTFMADTNGLLQFDDTNAPNFPARFYYTTPQ